MAEILVVDDERIVRTAIKDMLTENGFSVRLSHRGVHAVGQFLAKRPYLVLLDVMMPAKAGSRSAAKSASSTERRRCFSLLRPQPR